LLIGAAVLLSTRSALNGRTPAERPNLLLLTSLPILFGEGLSLDNRPLPVVDALERQYRLVPISATDRAELAKGKLLLMAHPAAQTAENLVTLDKWVRGGGRVLLLADPMVEWPSSLPMGDALRLAPMFMDTGLLAHWGLRLDSPEERGRQSRSLAGKDVVTVSPGTLHGRCAITADQLVANCRIGRGRAVVVADADFLAAGRIDGVLAANLDALLASLAELE
jgi:hypothetical protein